MFWDVKEFYLSVYKLLTSALVIVVVGRLVGVFALTFHLASTLIFLAVLPSVLRSMSEEFSIIDSHCHLDRFYHKGELCAVIEQAKAAGVDRMIAVGTADDD